MKNFIKKFLPTGGKNTPGDYTPFGELNLPQQGMQAVEEANCTTYDYTGMQDHHQAANQAINSRLAKLRLSSLKYRFGVLLLKSISSDVLRTRWQKPRAAL